MCSSKGAYLSTCTHSPTEFEGPISMVLKALASVMYRGPEGNLRKHVQINKTRARKPFNSAIPEYT